MATLGSLIIEMHADVARLEADMRKATGVVDREARAMSSKAAAAASAAIAKLSAGLAGALTAGAFVNFIRGGIDAADTMNRLAKQSGIVVDEFSRLAYAAELADVSNETLVSSLARFSTVLDEAARGGERARETLRDLRVTELADVTKAFRQAAETISKLPDSAEKIALLRRAFGRGGIALGPLFEGGAEGIREAEKEADKLGKTISREMGASADAVKDNFTKLNASWQGLQNTLAADVLPTLRLVTDEAARAAVEGNALLGIYAGARAATSTAIENVLGLPNLDDKREKLDELIDRLNYLRGEGIVGSIDKAFVDLFGKDRSDEIARVTAEIQKLNDEILVIQKAGEADFLPRRGGNERPKASAAAAVLAPTEEQIRAAEQLRRREDDAIRQLGALLAAERDTTEAARVRFEMEQGAYKEFSAASKEKLKDLAAELDLMRDQIEAAKESIEVQNYLRDVDHGRREDAAAAADEKRRERQAVIESLRTPEENYSADIRRLLELDIGGEQLQRGIAKAREQLDSAREKANEVSDAVRDLGLTFSSAFEDAVLGGEKFSDVINGLTKDIARLLLRKTVIEPIINGLGNLFGGSGSGGGGSGIGYAIGQMFGSLFSNDRGGLYRVAGSGGGERPVAFTARAGEVVAVGTGLQRGAGGGDIQVINVGAAPQRTERRQVNGKRQLVQFFSSTAYDATSEGALSALGIAPPLVSR